MTPEDESDSDGAGTGTTTDPLFPPRIGVGGPAPVTVTAVQGPAPSSSRTKEGSTEKLLTGLLESENDAYLYRVKSKDSAGEDALAYDVSPRPIPVAYKTQDEPPVIFDERRASTTPPGGGLKAAKREMDSTAPGDLRRLDKWVAFAVALLVVGVAGIFVVIWRTQDATPPPISNAPPAPQSVRDPSIPAPNLSPTLAAPQAPAGVRIEGSNEPAQADTQRPQPRSTRGANGTAATPMTATGTAPVASSAKPAGPLPPDYDELKKGISH